MEVTASALFGLCVSRAKEGATACSSLGRKEAGLPAAVGLGLGHWKGRSRKTRLALGVEKHKISDSCTGLHPHIKLNIKMYHLYSGGKII